MYNKINNNEKISISAKQRIVLIVELQPSGLPKEMFKEFLH